MTPPTMIEHNTVPIDEDVDGLPKFGIPKDTGPGLANEPDTKEIVSTSL